MEIMTVEKVEKLNKEGWSGYYEDLYDKIRGKFKYLDYGDTVKHRGQKIDDQVLYSLTFRTGKLNEVYDDILRYCLDEGVANVCDIGIAYGWQSDMFLYNDIEYYGVDVHISRSVRNFHEEYYYEGYYEETELDVPEDTVGVAVLSIGWNVYAQTEDTIIKQFTKLRDDFKTSVVYIPSQSVDVIRHLFKEVRVIKEGSTCIYELIS